MDGYFDTLLKVSKEANKVRKGSLLKKADSPVFRDLIYHAYSPTIKPVRPVVYELGSLDDAWNHVDPTTLYAGLLLKEPAEVKVLIEKFAPPHRPLVHAILTQTLNLGLKVPELNKIFKGLIPQFGVQKGRPFDLRHVTYPATVIPTPVGMRAIIYNDDRGAVMWSRRGKIISPSFPHLMEAIRQMPFGVYDGRITHPSDNFHLLNGIIHSMPNIHPAARETAFAIMDRIELQDWFKPKMEAAERFRLLSNGVATAKSKNPKLPIYWVGIQRVLSLAKIIEWHELYTANGYQCTTILPAGPYRKTTQYTSKVQILKDFTLIRATVLEWFPGNDYNAFEDGMGSLRVKDEQGAEFIVGFGFEHHERRTTEGWVGRTIEVKIDGYKDGRPIFPTYIRTLSNS